MADVCVECSHGPTMRLGNPAATPAVREVCAAECRRTALCLLSALALSDGLCSN